MRINAELLGPMNLVNKYYSYLVEMELPQSCNYIKVLTMLFHVILTQELSKLIEVTIQRMSTFGDADLILNLSDIIPHLIL